MDSRDDERGSGGQCMSDMDQSCHAEGRTTMSEHQIRAARTEEVDYRMKPDDRERSGMAQWEEMERAPSPWEEIWCTCGETFDSLSDAREHLENRSIDTGTDQSGGSV